MKARSSRELTQAQLNCNQHSQEKRSKLRNWWQNPEEEDSGRKRARGTQWKGKKARAVIRSKRWRTKAVDRRSRNVAGAALHSLDTESSCFLFPEDDKTTEEDKSRNRRWEKETAEIATSKAAEAKEAEARERLSILIKQQAGPHAKWKRQPKEQNRSSNKKERRQSTWTAWSRRNHSNDATKNRSKSRWKEREGEAEAVESIEICRRASQPNANDADVNETGRK